MLRPEELARPAAARTFTTELAWAGSPLCPRRLLLDGLIVIYHRRTFTGWTGSLMGCKRINTKNSRGESALLGRGAFPPGLESPPRTGQRVLDRKWFDLDSLRGEEFTQEKAVWNIFFPHRFFHAPQSWG